jgi:hypothetical protein
MDGALKLFLVCMIRNEIDILPGFLRHVDTLFDCGCLVDHLSCDGSESLLQSFVSSRPGWECQPIRTPAYLQAEKCTELLLRGFSAGADAVFFLDADEFISGLDRDALEAAVLNLNTQNKIGQLRWRNCLPADYSRPFSVDNAAWLCDLSPHKKIIVPRWLYEKYGDGIRMNQGNHSLRLPVSGDLSQTAVAELLHFPVRSREQLVRKIFISYVSQVIRPGNQIAPHIQNLFDILTRFDLTHEVLNALAVNYGVQLPVVPLMDADLKQRGYALAEPVVSRRDLDLALPVSSTCKFIDLGILCDENGNLQRMN